MNECKVWLDPHHKGNLFPTGRDGPIKGPLEPQPVFLNYPYLSD